MTGQAAPFSPIALVGTIALLAAYLVAAWGVAAGIAGNARKSRRLVASSVYALYAFAALASVASALLIYGFVTHDFSIKYIAAQCDVSMSTWSKVTAFWGGLDGSLLFWVVVLALFSTVAIAMNVKKHRDMIGYVVATILVVQVFFVSLLIFSKNPFDTTLTSVPVNGKCLNPLLQNYWMVIHPPSLYIGFVAATIPFAFGIGALASGRLDDAWLGSVRVWMLICFGFLSLGLILGGRWAYEELGWGGYWAWDPVENAGFIPWFTATAWLHAAIIQEQRGLMKRWNLVLVVLTFFFTIYGTFMTRSGIVQSVHAFGEDNVLALQFVVFMVIILVVSFGLIVYRSNRLATKAEFDSFYSREWAFLYNNWILLACAFFVLFATMFPTMSESLDGRRVSVGIPFFNRWMTPLALALLFLAGAAPLLAWRKTTRERLWRQFMFPAGFAFVVMVAMAIAFPHVLDGPPIIVGGWGRLSWLKIPATFVNFAFVAFVFASISQEFVRGIAVRRKQSGADPISATLGMILVKRRRYGGYIVHLGVAIMFIGFGGKAYDRQIDRTIDRPAIADPNMRFGDNGSVTSVPRNSASAFTFGDYEFVYERIILTSDDQKDAVTAQVSIWRDGEHLTTVYPAKWKYACEEEATTEVAIHVRPGEDIYVVLTGYDLDSKLANFRVYINPLILWVWIGFFVLALGTLICLIPQSVIDSIMGTGGTRRVGRAGEAALILLISGAIVAGTTAPAYAQGEHVKPGVGMGDSGVGWAAMNRPDSGTASSAMKELLCMCGCPRESIFDCKCQPASQSRGRVLAILHQTDASGKPLYDLTTDDGKERAYDAVLDDFITEYGEAVLATPRSKFSWLLPAIGAIGGLALLVVVGRGWVSRGRAHTAQAVAAATAAPEDAAYADKLDDELAKTD